MRKPLLINPNERFVARFRHGQWEVWDRVAFEALTPREGRHTEASSKQVATELNRSVK